MSASCGANVPIIDLSIINALPGNLPQKWSEPATAILAMLAVGWLVRDWAMALAKARDARRDAATRAMRANERLIENLQQELQRTTEQRDRLEAKNDQSEAKNNELVAEMKRLAKVHEEVVHENKTLRMVADLLQTEVHENAPPELREKVDESMAQVRKRATERRADRGEVPPVEPRN